MFQRRKNRLPSVPEGSEPPTVETSSVSPSIDNKANRTIGSTLGQLIEQKTWENAQLRLERRRQQQKARAGMYLVTEARHVVESLDQAIEHFERLHAELEGESEASQVS
jgi:molecular chaperone GrpE (heat shock protein)